MSGRRNPLKFEPPSGIKVPLRRQRPDRFLSDDYLSVGLVFWQGGMKVSPDLQAMLNFRLAELLDEKRVPLSPMQQALKDVATLTSGELGPGWSETHACKEAARVRGVSETTLARMWRAEKQRAKPRTKTP